MATTSGKVMESYDVAAGSLGAAVEIVSGEDFVRLYTIKLPAIEPGTRALLDSVKEELFQYAQPIRDSTDMAAASKAQADMQVRAAEVMISHMPSISPEIRKFLTGWLVQEMLGLGPLELLLADAELEEVVVNSSTEPVWVYHRKHGWLKTNLTIPDESQIQNYANIIARKAGRQITAAEPILDAHLSSGDRAHATLFPISTKGNTLTIRKFRRKPWTITDLIANGTVSAEVSALMWLAIQYELNMVIAGGTSSGKTTLMSALMPFIQPSHRIISIEDTRELNLPRYLHWVPLSVRPPNPEGKGEVSMLQLMVNSLRMRPDRIVVGEIRSADQAEVLFEAMHTGHSVYSTIHSDTAEQVVRRMSGPPISIPEMLLEAINLIVVQQRDRRTGVRKVSQIAEVMPASEGEHTIGTKARVLYRLRPSGELAARDRGSRLMDTLKMHTGMSDAELDKDLQERQAILNSLVKAKLSDIDEVGKVMAEYYADKESLLKSLSIKV